MSVRGSSANILDADKSEKAAPSQAFYRKYRPTKFDEIIGQPQVTDILKASVTKRDFAHAYLFTGQRGTGKTSAARILAHAINQTNYGSDDFDIIEIDAASNGSVDDARELREKAVIAPIAADHKIYIIDEVHMLSTAAFNALLKLIEEPPEHIIFILATTEIQKVPATILSRVQRFHFRPVSIEMVASHLSDIAKREKIDIDTEALNLVAERGGGSLRDSISLLDQLASSNSKITRSFVEDVLGLAPESSIRDIVNAIMTKDLKTLLGTLRGLTECGIPTSLITSQLIAELMKLAPEKSRLYALIERLLEVSKSNAPDIKLAAILASSAAKSTTVATSVKQSVKDETLSIAIEKSIEKENVVTAAQDVKPTGTPPDDIIWNDVLNEIKRVDEPAAYANMSFAQTEYENSTLTLYFSKPFHRKKAETTKMQSILASAIQTLYDAVPSVVVAKTGLNAVDSKNSAIASVADIMGGGEIIKEA